jgi:hypothetical protein
MTKSHKPLQASKWLHIQFLIDSEEMKELFSVLSPFVHFSVMGVTEQGGNRLEHQQFLEAYQRYIATLKEGKSPQDSDYRFFFTGILTKTEETVTVLPLPDNREMVRPILPCIQMQLHRFDYSKVDHEIRPMVLGKETISWGVQCSYPQLFQDPETAAVLNALDETLFPNASLFRAMREWIRRHSDPTPFIIQGKKEVVPIRLGKMCRSWIGSHKELQLHGLKIA